MFAASATEDPPRVFTHTKHSSWSYPEPSQCISSLAPEILLPCTPPSRPKLGFWPSYSGWTAATLHPSTWVQVRALTHNNHHSWTLDPKSLLWLLILCTLLLLLCTWTSGAWGVHGPSPGPCHCSSATAQSRYSVLALTCHSWVHCCSSVSHPKGSMLWLWPVIAGEHCSCSAPQDTKQKLQSWGIEWIKWKIQRDTMAGSI